MYIYILWKSELKKMTKTFVVSNFTCTCTFQFIFF